MQNRRVKIVQVHSIDGGFVAHLIGLPIGAAATNPTTGQPSREAMGIVIPPRFATELGDRQSTELPTPNDQRIIEHPALLKVREQTGNRPIRLVGELLVVTRDVHVPVPGPLVLHPARVDLYKANASLEESASHQALASKVIAFGIPNPVELVNMLRFIAKIQRLWSLALHSEGQFKALDASRKLSIRSMVLQVHLVELSQGVQLLPLDGSG